MLNEFIEYLKENLKTSDIVTDTFFNTGDSNNYTSPVNLDSLVCVESIFKKWIVNYYTDD